MGLAYVKVYFDFEDRTEMLNETEQGRLLLTMLRYAEGKTLPELKGNERFLFPVFKAEIDREAAVYATKCENGAHGGRPSKPKKTENNRMKPDETEDNRPLKNKNKNKNKTEEQEQEQDSISPPRLRAVSDAPAGFDEFWMIYPKKVAKQDAMKAWKALKPNEALRAGIIADITKRLDGEWSGKELRYIPNPTTYLHQRRWEDETTGGRTDGEHRGTAAEEGPKWTLPGEIVL